MAGRRKGPAGGAAAYAKDVQDKLLARVADGETVEAVCRDADMPSRGTVTAWAKASKRFRDALSRAKTLGGWDPVKAQRAGGYDPVTAREILARLTEGEALSAICDDPGMPAMGVVERWRASTPEFAERVALARQANAEAICDESLAIARGLDRETAFAAKVTLEHLRWAAGVYAPRRFGRTRPVEGEAALAAAAAARTQTVLLRHFEIETRADGCIRVVGFTPDPETGRAVRDTPLDAPWEPPPKGLWLRTQAVAALREAGIDPPPALLSGPGEDGG